ncbi:efflux transporter outer membrane subunit [Erythrobacter sp. CCH5-A1]|jgi:NodT family efflux transporter outer membrane factor (OMF) lipoprotein|uniref:efflux transporter outer membrane subunit n=1 Tax=Erythrobacter sp. CCH5-A1 TaxID=1768792 RepID=UPI00082EEB1A|nr:efflux transporter outer membrane subunit [Erythrobacter sp. CCH5-A1]
MTAAWRAAWCLAIAAPALSGCALSREDPPAMASAQPLPERWVLAPPGETAVPLDRYWTMLDDPLVSEFVARAQAENLDLAQAAARLRAARAGLRQAEAEFLPTISGSGGAQRDVGDLARNGVQFSLGANAQWEADLFGRIDASRDAARGDLQAAGYSLGDLERVIAAQVATQVISARAIAGQLAIARETLAVQDDNLQIARWRNQAGLVSSLDVEQARTQRAQTAASIPLLESNLVAVANAISTLIGEPPGRVYRAFTEAPRAVPVPPQRVALAAPADLLRRRPDVSAAEARLAASLDRIGVARAQLYPLARLSGTLNTGASDVGNLFDIVTGNVFASLSQLIFDGGRVRGQIDAARANADGSLAAWRQSILAALEEVESAAVDLDTSDARVIALTEASEGAQNAAILARSQYQAGLIDFQTLLVTESQLLSARNALVSAQGARAQAFIALARAMGGGWSVPDAAAINPVSGEPEA